MYKLSNGDSPSSTHFRNTVKSFLLLSTQLCWTPRKLSPSLQTSLTQTWKPRDLLAPSEVPRSLTTAAPRQTGARQAVLQTIKRVSLKKRHFYSARLFCLCWQIKADILQYTLFCPVLLSNRRCFVGKGSGQL